MAFDVVNPLPSPYPQARHSGEEDEDADTILQLRFLCTKAPRQSPQWHSAFKKVGERIKLHIDR